MRVISNNSNSQKPKILSYPRAGLYLLGGLACISLIALGTLFSRNTDTKKRR